MTTNLLSIIDANVYSGWQAGKGLPPSPANFLGASKFTSVNVSTELEVSEGEPGLGGGMYDNEDMGLSFIGNFTLNGEISLKSLFAHLLEYICLRTTTGSSGNPYRHRYTGIPRNYSLPWIMLAVVFGESSTRGVGLATRFLTDCRLNTLEFNISTTDSVKFNAGGQFLNYGSGTGSESFQADETTVKPSPTNSANVFTFPTWITSIGTPCFTSVALRWIPRYTLADPCLTTAEHAGMVISRARWELVLTGVLDDVTMQIHDMITTKSTTPTGYRSMKSDIKKGDFGFTLKSIENMGADSPMNVPYEYKGFWPSQFISSKIDTSKDPNSFELTLRNYNNSWWIECYNDLAPASQRLNPLAA